MKCVTAGFRNILSLDGHHRGQRGCHPPFSGSSMADLYTGTVNQSDLSIDLDTTHSQLNDKVLFLVLGSWRTSRCVP